MREQDTIVLTDSSEKWEMALVLFFFGFLNFLNYFLILIFIFFWLWFLMSSEEETLSRLGIRECKKRMSECWLPFAHVPWKKMIFHGRKRI